MRAGAVGQQTETVYENKAAAIAAVVISLGEPAHHARAVAREDLAALVCKAHGLIRARLFPCVHQEFEIATADIDYIGLRYTPLYIVIGERFIGQQQRRNAAPEANEEPEYMLVAVYIIIPCGRHKEHLRLLHRAERNYPLKNRQHLIVTVSAAAYAYYRSHKSTSQKILS